MQKQNFMKSQNADNKYPSLLVDLATILKYTKQDIMVVYQ